ncbi:MAG: peptidoglycan DD-metalloendopeptidase family protein [Fusobacteriales bacterium]|jgi:septal ring factor EnvC (AmiA/AmiB activator)|nr:peptidoglycan DD-metalloendopeptidase family protein [Fusobacteriales bacterium]
MRKKTKVAFIFILVFSIMYTDQKDKNNARIKQINTQINRNNQKINKNSGEINKAKKDENVTISQLRNIEAQIKKLQAEYDDAQKRYIDVLREIGKNDDEIRKDINEINRNSEIINVNKEDLAKKMIIWDRIRRKETLGLFSDSGVVVQDKRNHDLKIFLNNQKQYIQVVEKTKEGVESDKKQTETLKSQNQAQASRIMSARNDLESKNKQLNAAKQEQNRIIAALRTKQNKLSSENKTIQQSNNKLVTERRKLEAEIQAIIAREIRAQQIAAQKAEEERIRLAEAERIRREAEKGGASGERNNSNLSGEKPTTSAGNTNKTTTTTAYSPPKGTGSLMMPMSGRIVTNYGQEKIQGLTSKGIEIRGSVGQAVKAADSGNVIYSGSLNNLGNVVIIDHGNLITVYGNLSGVSVSKGQKVSKGQSIGSLGRDINREANLYFETRRGVNTVNPMNYL